MRRTAISFLDLPTTISRPFLQEGPRPVDPLTKPKGSPFKDDKGHRVIGYARNIAALKVSRLQGNTQASLGGYYEQLSSGLRINRPSADPAGLAVSQRLTVDTRVTNRARLNVTDGISFVNSADSAYEAASSIMNRLGELATQSASGSLSSAQRSALSAEFNALKSEVVRIQESTRFNGQGTADGGLVARSGSTISSGVYDSSVTFLSADGRYITYASGISIFQKDLETNTTTTIATGLSTSALQMDVTPFGDAVAYFDGSGRVKHWDRLTGVTSTAPIEDAYLTAQPYNALTISDDGSSIAFLTENMFDSTYGEYSNHSFGILNLTVYDVTSGTMRGDDGLTQIGTDATAMSFSPDGTRVLIQATNNTFGTFGAGTHVVSNLVAGFELFDENAMNRAVIGADNFIYYDSGGAIYKKSSGSSAVAITSIFSGTGVASLSATNGGNSLSITSTGNPTGMNGGGSTQLFKVSLSGEIEQVTNYTTNSLASFTTIAGDGNSILGYSGTTNVLYDTRPLLSLGVEAGKGTQGGITSEILSLQGAIRGLQSMNISSRRSAQATLAVIKDDTARLSLARGNIGASLSRLGSAQRILLSDYDELSAANSRIRDVDVAQSVAQSTRLQILADTQVAILGQASRIEPEIALQLLESSTATASSYLKFTPGVG